jgi:hypothetical protein
LKKDLDSEETLLGNLKNEITVELEDHAKIVAGKEKVLREFLSSWESDTILEELYEEYEELERKLDDISRVVD